MRPRDVDDLPLEAYRTDDDRARYDVLVNGRRRTDEAPSGPRSNVEPPTPRPARRLGSASVPDGRWRVAPAVVVAMVALIAVSSTTQSVMVAPTPSYEPRQFRWYDPATATFVADAYDLPDPRELPPPPPPTPRPGKPVVRRTGSVKAAGLASWHATGRDGLYAAACRPLRRALGSDWRGQRVLVVSARRVIEVRLNDWCGSHTKLIDLSDEAFRALAPLSRGVVRVVVEGFR